MKNLRKEYGSLKELLKRVLAKCPETRSDDTKLFIQCCKELGATTLDDLYNMNISIISVHKTRQVIQNKEKLYQPAKKFRGD